MPSEALDELEVPTEACFCGTEVDSRWRSDAAHGREQITCPVCGPYVFTARGAPVRLGPEQRLDVAFFVKTRNLRGDPPPVLHLRRSRRPKDALNLDDIRAACPRGVERIQDELLITLSAMTRELGYGSFWVLRWEDAPAARAFGFAEMRFHLRQLEGAGHVAILEFENPANEYIGDLERYENQGLGWMYRDLESLARGDAQYDTRFGAGIDVVAVRLTNLGWKRVEELRRGVVENPRQAFVAMWFDGALEQVYLQGIEPAIQDAGYDARQLAFVEHNDDIDDRIIAEIRKSRFLVADFTGGRGGVYFEAGFALGLGKPVIWTCKREWFEEQGVHFDTEHKNHILWEDAHELREKLRARIEATVTDGS